MSSTQVSVIVPVYNVERYLEKCIQSICGQSFADIEVILVDDGSTDASANICDEWAQRDDRVHVIHKENGGLSDARNAGIDAADGQWLMFVDSDDFITMDTIELLYTAAVKKHCEIALCNMVRVYDDGTTEPFYNPVGEQTIWDGVQRFETLKQPSVCNKIFRTELFEGVRFPKGKYYEDTFVYHVLLDRATAVALTGHDGYYYLSRRESILGQPKYTDRYFDMTEAVYERMTYLLAHDIPLYADEACLSMYAVVANAEKHIQESQQNEAKFKQMRQQFKVAYKHLMKSSKTGIKQRLRLLLLKNLPSWHSVIY